MILAEILLKSRVAKRCCQFTGFYTKSICDKPRTRQHFLNKKLERVYKKQILTIGGVLVCGDLTFHVLSTQRHLRYYRAEFFSNKLLNVNFH